MHYLDELLKATAYSAAAALRRKHGLMAVPVPVEEIARREGVAVHRTVVPFDGSVVKTAAGYAVSLDASASLERQRFTLAHELGHILFGSLTSLPEDVRYRQTRFTAAAARYGRDELYYAEERFCNWFANRLLIPADGIADMCDWSRISISGVRARASEIGVSFSALVRRLLEELPYRGGYLWLKQGDMHSQSGGSWRVEYALFPKERRVYRERHRELPSSSILHRCCEADGEKTYRNVDLTFCGVYGSRNVLASRYRTAIVAIILPREVDPDILIGDQQSLDGRT